MPKDTKNPEHRQLILWIDFQYVKELFGLIGRAIFSEIRRIDNALKKIVGASSLFTNDLFVEPTFLTT